MGLADILRTGVATINRVTADLQVTVSHKAWIGSTASGPKYAAGVARLAIVEQGPKPWRTAKGEVVSVKAIIYILEAVAANGATGREEPIDARDQFTLANGTIGAPIEGAGGPVDPLTSHPFFYTVALG